MVIPNLESFNSDTRYGILFGVFRDRNYIKKMSSKANEYVLKLLDLDFIVNHFDFNWTKDQQCDMLHVLIEYVLTHKLNRSTLNNALSLIINRWDKFLNQEQKLSL